MTQLEIVPLRIIEFRPLLGRPTAHALGRALAEDDEYYIVKQDSSPTDCTCATEWLCSSIADSLNLPVAEAKILQGMNGELLYGSREIRPRLPEIEAQRLLLSGSANNVFVPQLAEHLASTYALDLAIGNLDRHQDNFIISLGSDNSRQQVGQLHLIDFASSDILSAERISLPFPEGSNTVKVGRMIRAKHRFARDAAQTLLSRLLDGRKFIAERALFGVPPQWLPKDRQTAFSDWIVSGGFETRVRNIETGLTNGTYL